MVCSWLAAQGLGSGRDVHVLGPSVTSAITGPYRTVFTQQITSSHIWHSTDSSWIAASVQCNSVIYSFSRSHALFCRSVCPSRIVHQSFKLMSNFMSYDWTSYVELYKTEVQSKEQEGVCSIFTWRCQCKSTNTCVTIIWPRYEPRPCPPSCPQNIV